MAFLPVNLAGVNPAAGFENLPPGQYLLEVESAEVKTNKDGKTQRLAITNKVVMGPGAESKYVGRKVFNNYNLTDQGKPFLARFAKAVGIDGLIAQNGGNIDSDWAIGKQFYAKISIKNDNNNVGNEQSIAEVQAKQSVPQSAAIPAGMMRPAAAPQTIAQPQYAQPVSQYVSTAVPQYAQPTLQMVPGMQPMPQQYAQPVAQQQFQMPAPPPPPAKIG